MGAVMTDGFVKSKTSYRLLLSDLAPGLVALLVPLLLYHRELEPAVLALSTGLAVVLAFSVGVLLNALSLALLSRVVYGLLLGRIYTFAAISVDHLHGNAEIWKTVRTRGPEAFREMAATLQDIEEVIWSADSSGRWGDRIKRVFGAEIFSRTVSFCLFAFDGCWYGAYLIGFEISRPSWLAGVLAVTAFILLFLSAYLAFFRIDDVLTAVRTVSSLSGCCFREPLLGDPIGDSPQLRRWAESAKRVISAHFEGLRQHGLMRESE